MDSILGFITDNVLASILSALAIIGGYFFKKGSKKIFTVLWEVTEVIKAILDAFQLDADGKVVVTKEEVQKIKKEISDVRALFAKPTP